MKTSTAPIWSIQEEKRIWNVRCHPKFNLIAFTSENRLKSFYFPRNKNSEIPIRTHTEAGHERSTRSLAFSIDGTKLALCSFDATVSLWDIKGDDNFPDIKFTKKLKGQEQEIKSISWSPSTAEFATGSRDHTIWVHQLVESKNEYMCGSILNKHSQDVKCVDWSTVRPEFIASASYDNTVNIWTKRDSPAAFLAPSIDTEIETDDWICLQTITTHDNTLWCARFNPHTGTELVVACQDGTLSIWTYVIDKCQETPDFNRGNSMDLASSLYTSKLFRLQVPKMTARWKCSTEIQDSHNSQCIYDVQFNPMSPDIFATACGDSNVRIFSRVRRPQEEETWEVTRILSFHTGEVNSVAWDHDGNLLISAGDDGHLCVWDVADALIF
eukprot:GHVP01051722.1.p1 GENE.GHVP01051722.1~~GHVP01051722.1.p1  ORF type:complete len:384 (-),score=51.45 GHVP01051722.1:48-1199(-)